MASREDLWYASYVGVDRMDCPDRMRLSESLNRANSLYVEAVDRLSYRIDSLTPDTVQVMKDEVKAARALAKQARRALDQHRREHGCLSVEQVAACGETP